MNEINMPAFDAWYRSEFGESVTDDIPSNVDRGMMTGWQAAWEYRQREIDGLKDRVSELESTSVVRSLEIQRNALKSRVARLEGFAKDVHRWTIPSPHDEREAPLQRRIKEAAWAVLQEAKDANKMQT